MKHSLFVITMLAFASLSLVSCGDNAATETKDEPAAPKYKEEKVTYSADTVKMDGFVVYNEAVDTKRPAVLVVPEWWGLNEYTRSRARQLAELGYVAMAIDLYGNGEVADNPERATALATPFYQDFALGKTRFDAALAKLKTYAQVDTANIAAIGYCFGGSQVLNAAKMGDNLKAVVSFHGGLATAPADKNLLKAKILVCHGEADQFIKPEELATFRKQLDSIGADYQFKTYANATHAFTNPNATATGEKFKMPISYNAAADSASWNDMKQFLGATLK